MDYPFACFCGTPQKCQRANVSELPGKLVGCRTFRISLTPTALFFSRCRAWWSSLGTFVRRRACWRPSFDSLRSALQASLEYGPVELRLRHLWGGVHAAGLGLECRPAGATGSVVCLLTYKHTATATRHPSTCPHNQHLLLFTFLLKPRGWRHFHPSLQELMFCSKFCWKGFWHGRLL